MTTKTIQDLAKIIHNVDGVIRTSIWEKAGHRRIYIETPKRNGGKDWNGGKAGGNLYYDFTNDRLHWDNSTWAGARTRDLAYEIIDSVREAINEALKDVAGEV